MNEANNGNKPKYESAWEKIGIKRNDEPTRFLSPEELDELHNAVFTGKPSKQKEQVNIERSDAPKIKVEEVKPAEMKKIKQEQQAEAQSFAGTSGEPLSEQSGVDDSQEKFANTADIGGPVQPKPKKRKRKYWKYALLIIGFVIALVAGFYLAFCWNSYNESAMNAKAHDVQQLKQQEEQLSNQQQFLQQRRQELEEQKAQLDQQQKELNADKSFVRTILDRLTGKEEEQNAQYAELQSKIDKAQTMIDEVSTQMDDVDTLKQRIIQLKDAAQNRASESDGIIESAKTQIQSFFNKFLQ